MGLANPDNQYHGTRHNIGAVAVTVLTQRLGARARPHRSGAVLADSFTPASRVPLSLGRPGGHMNNSGGPTAAALAFYKLPLEQLVVVHDEMDLPLGVVRLKMGGGTSGHNGLKDIAQRCGGKDFHRVRIGIGRPPGRMDPAAYVLKGFGPRERDEAAIAAERAADAVVDLVDMGLEAAQNRHH